MSLDKAALKQAIKQAFEKAKKTEAPKDLTKIDEVQNQILNQLSLDLAEAIDAFVKGGSITSVNVEVKDASNNVIGTGTQKGTGKIE